MKFIILIFGLSLPFGASIASAGNGYVTKITSDAPAFLDGFGNAIAIWDDCILVGASGYDSTPEGAAILFKRQGNDWALDQHFPVPASALDLGRAVVLRSDHAAVSSFAPEGGRRVWAYDRVGSDWVLAQELFSNAVLDDFYGASLAMSDDTLVVGAPGTGISSEATPGFVHVYRLIQGAWQLEATLNGDLVEGDTFGTSVAIDGNRLLVGASNRYTSPSAAGAAFTFTRAGSTWMFEERIVPDASAMNDRFASSVALAGDLAVVAGPGAYSFRRVGGAWMQEAQFRNDFQRAVAIDDDLVIVANSGQIGTAGSGRAFVEVNGAHYPQGRMTAYDPASMQYFGVSVSSSAGTTAVGASRSDTDLEAGAVYLFERPVGESHCESSVNSSGGAAQAYARGSASVQTDSLELAAVSVPNKPGLFFAGTAAIQAPFGPAYRCVGGSVRRFRPTLAGNGVLEMHLDLSTGTFAPGSTWYFQAWFRDNPDGIQSFNTSTGVSITFAP